MTHWNEICAAGLFGAALSVGAATGGAAEPQTYDIVVYGSTPAAISAAVQAKRMGKSCVIVSPETRLGGLTTGGLGQTDIGNKAAFGGIALEFYRAVAAWYRDDAHWTREKRADYLPDGQCADTKGTDSMWTFEPSAALAILEGWVKRDGLEVVRGERLDLSRGGVLKHPNGHLVRIRTLSGRTFAGKMFVDATYEGDLMAAAGVTHTVGREANAQYGETLNGVQTAQAKWHQFGKGVDPYVVAGDPKSGLIPGVEPFDPDLQDGTADRRVQAYCFRMCLTDDPANRIPFAKPSDYDERNYELLFRMFAAKPKGTYAADRLWELPWINSRMPNRKTDTNNRDAFSTDFIGRNWNWPEASYEVREKILKAHLAYQKGLMWTLANHPRVPEAVRREVSRWGTCRDEFRDGPGDGWQTQLYVREARRLVGDYVVTEHDCTGRRVAPRPVAMAAYTMDSHNVRRHVGADGFVHNEGDVEVGGGKPYGLDYGALVPRRGECGNLLVPVCVSASHIAFGSIRMEPVFFALGQAAATAAAQAIDAKCAVQDLPYDSLAAQLVRDGQVLSAADGERRLLAWLVALDASAGAKSVDSNRAARAKAELCAYAKTVPDFRAWRSAPLALFATRALWTATGEWWWGQQYKSRREEPAPGASVSRLDVCAAGGFAADAKPTEEERRTMATALHELCQRESDGFAALKYRAGCGRYPEFKLPSGFVVRTNELTTAWGRKVTPDNAWREYPRPQMVREGMWHSLNGTWDLTVEPSGDKAKILVPFPVESQLSGVRRRVLPTDELVYRRKFAAKRRAGFRTLLNFEAVDFRAQVFVNGVEALDVPHEGGYVPFAIDVTDLLAADGGNDLEVRVWDPTDTFIGSTGKQTLQLRTCFFPPSSGIVGSVWTEETPETYLESYRVTADPDTGKVVVTPAVKGNLRGARVKVEVFDRPGSALGLVSGELTRSDRPIVLQLPKPWRCWSCAFPNLYGLRFTVAADGREDRVEGYFGVRQLKLARDAKGIAKLALNGKPVYLLGVLDQGYWPDGYLTPPSEDACRWDIDYLKDVGMNCIRKHIKIEPRCFYAHCDRQGIMVMQDMPSAWRDDIQHDRARANTRYGHARRELKEIVDLLGNHPSVVCWIPYNESWSQPDEAKTFAVGRWLKRYDPTRLVDLTSGWSHFEDGWTTAWSFDAKHVRPTSEFVTDIIDWHDYPGPKIGKANPDRAIICGEFGANAGGAIDGHYTDIRGKAVRFFPDTPEGLAEVRMRNLKAYRAQTDRVLKQVGEGSSGSILCEDIDCFWEGGGFVSFDRAIERFERADLRAFHREVYDAYAREFSDGGRR